MLRRVYTSRTKWQNCILRRVYSSRKSGDILYHDEYTRHERIVEFHIKTSIFVLKKWRHIASRRIYSSLRTDSILNHDEYTRHENELVTIYYLHNIFSGNSKIFLNFEMSKVRENLGQLKRGSKNNISNYHE